MFEEIFPVLSNKGDGSGGLERLIKHLTLKRGLIREEGLIEPLW